MTCHPGEGIRMHPGDASRPPPGIDFCPGKVRFGPLKMMHLAK